MNQTKIVNNVHWPDTMATFDTKTGILFSCDAFGSFGWSGGAQRELDEIVEKYRMNWEFIEPVEFKDSLREEDLNLIGTRIKESVNVVNSLF